MRSLLDPAPRPAALALTAALALGACSDVTGTENPTGTSSWAVSGDVTRSVRGDAFFVETTDPGTGGTAWLLHLVDGILPSRQQSVDVLRRAERPRVDTLMLVAAGTPGEVPPGGAGAFISFPARDDPPSPGFEGSATTGVLVITRSETEVVEGSVDLAAGGELIFPGRGRQPGRVRIQGRFEAVRGELVVTADGGMHRVSVLRSGSGGDRQTELP